jgi:cation:H+ antiporter
VEFLLPVIAVVLGLAGLVFGADRFVFGASNLARRMGVSPLVVGMLIVGIGTSAPEMLVSAIAAFEGASGIALGNVVGSNITNIGLVAGLAAVIRPMELQREVVRREIPVLIGVTAIATALLLDLELDVLDGVILAVLLAGFLWMTLRNSRSATSEDEPPHEPLADYGRATLWLVIGLALLVGSSRGVVWGASTVASALGVDELIIGLTIVAIGTSLPELASSVAAALKGEHAMAIGNVIGSNVFNVLGVLALPAIIAPGPIERVLLIRDCSVMAGMTLLLFLFAAAFDARGRINRVEGTVLLVLFAAYIGVLVLDATGTFTL